MNNVDLLKLKRANNWMQKEHDTTEVYGGLNVCLGLLADLCSAVRMAKPRTRAHTKTWMVGYKVEQMCAPA